MDGFSVYSNHRSISDRTGVHQLWTQLQQSLFALRAGADAITLNSLTSKRQLTDRVCAALPQVHILTSFFSYHVAFLLVICNSHFTKGSSAPSEIPQHQQLMNVIIRKWRHFSDVALLPCAWLPTFRSEFHDQALPRMAWKWGTYHHAMAVTHLEQCWLNSSYNAVTTTSNRFFAVTHLAPSQNCERRLLASSCLADRPRWTARLPPATFSWNLIWEFFENLSRKFSVHWNLIRIKGTLHEDQHSFMIISRPVLLRTKKKYFRQKLYRKWQQKFYVQKLPFENRAVYKIMWGGKSVQPGRQQMSIWRLHNARWIPKATNTHSKYVLLP